MPIRPQALAIQWAAIMSRQTSLPIEAVPLEMAIDVSQRLRIREARASQPRTNKGLEAREIRGHRQRRRVRGTRGLPIFKDVFGLLLLPRRTGGSSLQLAL